MNRRTEFQTGWTAAAGKPVPPSRQAGRISLTVFIVVGIMVSLLGATACSKTLAPNGSRASRLEIKVSDPFTIGTCPAKHGLVAEVFKDGTVYVVLGPPCGTGPSAYRSGDGGKTWEPATWSPATPGSVDLVRQLSDGMVLGIGMLTHKRGPGEFLGRAWFSKDGWKTVEGPVEVPVHIPRGTGGIGDDDKPFEGPVFSRSVVEMPDGSLLASMYGYFDTDTVFIPGGVPGGATSGDKTGYYKYRTLVVQSRDRGRSWSYLATVAYDPTVGHESFCEPAMARLSNGELLCIMRTGGSTHPLYQTWSKDGGKTWAKPVATNLPYGVDPDLVVLKNGLVACAYGSRPPRARRERNIAFSLDNGRTWTHNTVIQAMPGASYPAICEIRPGEILYVHQIRGFAEAANKPFPTKHYVLGSIIRVMKVDK